MLVLLVMWVKNSEKIGWEKVRHDKSKKEGGGEQRW